MEVEDLVYVHAATNCVHLHVHGACYILFSMQIFDMD